jgi:hypothetical protein
VAGARGASSLVNYPLATEEKGAYPPCTAKFE